MAAPLAAVTGKLAQKILVDLLNDPEKTIKGISLGLLVPLSIIVLIFALPVILIVSIPTLLVGGGISTPPEDIAKQLATISIYSSAPGVMDERNLEWIEVQKKKYANYDDIVVKCNFSLSWQSLMAIDSVRLSQDFSNVTQADVMALAERFAIRKVTTETYKVRKKTETGYKTVTKKRAIIDISTKSFDEVIDELGFNTFEKQVAHNIYSTLITSHGVDGGSTTVSVSVLDWKPQIEVAALKYNVDPALIAAIIHAESDGNPLAISPVGAIGLTQLMPGTASDLGVNPFDPIQNIDGGSHYISILLKNYTLQEAIASYNCGPGNVDNGNWVKFPETVNYVARVTALYQSYKPVFLSN